MLFRSDPGVRAGAGVLAAWGVAVAAAPHAINSTETKAIKLATQLPHWECVRFLVFMVSFRFGFEQTTEGNAMGSRLPGKAHRIDPDPRGIQGLPLQVLGQAVH